ncbi:dTDP-4-dehydrorhamnose reductase [Acidisphaera sp. L21]|uniref:dTDP-4-dehydrorhamnose reductase n=1 Tax=Acidisphaera sp. L21 TaxID=1641851 RepID=UPI0015751312|nr:dTDP-4-dehydrorhamnose reductase [Acidisphaera sp. L21]
MILVTGGAGQVATELAARSAQVSRVGRPEFDFDRPETIAASFDQVQPSLVVNAAAWTAVDAAEAEEAAALRANRDGPAELARLCAAAGIPLVHISTDYVFDGRKGAPYVETDPTCPTGVYGSSKLAGEQAVLSYDRAIVLRTSWVYAAIGKNFVRTMLGAAQKTKTLKVVADQHGCPTNAGDLADAILAIAARVADGWRPDYAGIFNAAGTGSTTWHGLALATFEEAARHGRAMPTVNPIATADWPTPAKRPPDSRLDCSKLARVFDVHLPAWRPSLAHTVDVIITV